MFLAETIFQQQEGTLWSIESTLTWVAVVATATGILLLIVGIGLGSRLGRMVQIATASQELMKQSLEEQKKATEYLKYIADRAYDGAAATAKNAAPPAQDTAARKAEPDVYRID